ncbi:MAG: hypothetical protein WBD71_17430 [Xanthobacteraceae bacterium]
MLRLSVVSVLIAAFASVASAQTIVINSNKDHVLPSSTTAAQVRVSLGINMFMPASGDDSAQSLKAQEDGRKLIYEAASHECELLRATIASDCQLEAINLNVQHVNANQNFNKADGYNINGNMNYRIVTK